MTIGVGFKCSDGIVLCADTQITWSQSHKAYETKIYGHRQHEWTVAFTYCGNPTLMKSFNEKFWESMKLVSQPCGVAKIRDVIETVLSFFDILKDHPEELSLLCAIAVPAEIFALYKTERFAIHEVKEYDYVGMGESSILRYLGQLIAQQSGKAPYGYTVQQASILATYLAMKAKTHMEGCGGESDAWIVHPSGTVEPKGLAWVHMTEQRMLKMEHLTRTAASLFFDGRVSVDEFAEALERLVKIAKEEHFEFRI